MGPATPVKPLRSATYACLSWAGCPSRRPRFVRVPGHPRHGLAWVSPAVGCTHGGGAAGVPRHLDLAGAVDVGRGALSNCSPRPHNTAAVPRRPPLDTRTHAALASWERGCASARGAPPRRRSRWGGGHPSRLATRPATTVVAKRGDGGSWRVRRGGRLCDCSAGDALPVEGCGAPARGGLGCGWLQPFSQKSRTPTVAKEFKIGLYDPAEADLELFCNSWSAGFLGERLYVLSFSVALALTNSLGWHAPRLFGALCANVFSVARSVCTAM